MLNGTHPRYHKGFQRFEEILDLQGGPKLLDPKRLHATEGWRGTRVVLIAFSVRSLEKLDPASREAAEVLGFVLPRPADAGGGALTLREPVGPSGSADTARPAAPQSVAELKSRASRYGHRFDPPDLCGGSLRVEPAPLLPASPDAYLSPAALDLLSSFPPGRFLFASVLNFLTLQLPFAPDRVGWISFRGSGASERVL